ncbi:regulatory protein [Agromyces cerinus]|uniref:regulatory protein RecX n=1 Tax=Agromyces cerinus TaxID=33878 RepID=UPI00195D89BD|nr:regulatory protein RecX [Agromyces cerinus]MBM7830936.1 regulatory protein [Agromyces cerinus]
MSDASSERLAPVTYLPWAKAEPTPPVAASRSRPTAEPESPPVAAPRNRQKADGGRGRLRSVSRNETWAESEAGSESREPSEPEESGAERDERIDRLVISRLRRSALSVSEVRAVLVEHGLDDIEVEEWIERYERLGYLDDAKLAEQVVHSHGVRRGRGSGAIMQELGRRGVDNALARAAVEDLDPETELENARAVAERRARQLRGLDRQTAERRLSAFLQRRGYPGDVVREAVTAALAAEGS